jgi:hypothetical protein
LGGKIPHSVRTHEMNDTTRGDRDPEGRPPARRAGAPAIVLAGLAVLAAACGGGNSSSTAGETAYQKALAYSQCMRAHGEPGFPDPQSDGSILINGRDDHLSGGLLQSATRACQRYMPKSPPLTAAQQRQLTAEALRFVACMRRHGLPGFPDPEVNSHGIAMQLPGGMAPNSPAVQAAQRACGSLMPGRPGGAHGINKGPS